MLPLLQKWGTIEMKQKTASKLIDGKIQTSLRCASHSRRHRLLQSAATRTWKIFLNSVNNSFSVLKDNPLYQIRYDDVRCLPIKKFPYMAHFTVDEIQQICSPAGLYPFYRCWEKFAMHRPELGTGSEIPTIQIVNIIKTI